MRTQILVTLILAISCGCHGGQRERYGPWDQAKVPPETAKKTEQPYLQWSEQQIQAFASKVQEVKLGDSCQQVEALLGTPWSDEKQYKKSWSHDFIGRTVKYYVRMQNKELVNVYLDQYVEFWFDPNDHLTEIYSQNVKGVQNRP